MKVKDIVLEIFELGRVIGKHNLDMTDKELELLESYIDMLTPKKKVDYAKENIKLVEKILK